MYRNNKKKVARRGEFWSINNKHARGHKSIIKRGNAKTDYVDYQPLTHAPKTNRKKNIPLRSNPQKGKKRNYLCFAEYF